MQKPYTSMKNLLLALVVLTLLFNSTALPLAAQSPTTSPAKSVSVTATGDGVILEWGSEVNNNAVTAASALQTLPTTHFQGYDLPMRLITLQLSANAKAATLPTALLQIEQINSVAWKDNLLPSGPLQPPALDWKRNTDLKPQEKVALPTSPIFVLRQGKIHGQPVAVVAISPLYQKNGVIQLATSFKAKAAGATQLDDNVANLLKALPAADNAISAAGLSMTNLAPTNSAAATNSVKIIVSKPGLQVLSSQSLASAGLNPGALDLTKLHLYHNGQEIPLVISQTPALEARFYAATAGDRWNLNEIYWLTVEATNGLRMATRDVTPSGATATQTASEKGYWVQNLVYNSLQAGADGDHWFNTTMEVAPTQLNNPASYPTATVTLNNVLPLAAGTSLYTFTVSTYFRANYKLHVDFGGTAQDLTWNSAPPPQGVLVENWALPLSTTATPSQIQLTLLPGNEVQGLNLDRVYWQRPVSLNFQNQGAAFTGLNGAWLYNWQNAPTTNGQYQLYDVSTPDAPVSLTGANGSGFQDGPTAHDYLLAGPGVIQTPQVVAHSAFVFSSAAGADAIYIAPSQDYITALKPLLDQRSAQGYTVTTVNAQDIYDAWSYGHVSAEAIRSFLRFAKANWHPSPISVVLIGDATWDPHGYLNLGANNVNLMPAYMADVDPYIGETACENCFVQLDGDNPVTGDDPPNTTQPGKFFKADMWIGRFPVKTVGELTSVVNKIIHYENQASTGFWRGTAVFLADNYIKSLDPNGKPVVDSAGDFASISDDSVNLAPKQTQIKRVYYDPYPQISDPQHLQPWRVSDANTTWSDVMSDLNAGAGLVTYNGHSHHWQWGSTDVNAPKPYLFSLYDTDLLTNFDSLFIELSMTCYTSQFTKAASSGTTFDERMFLNPKGGAVAIWGPAGLSVAHGHDALQRGFYTKLWASEPMKARVGELLEAGYTELLTKSTCCQDAIQTFLLLGDPLTPARINAAATPSASIFLPIINRK